MINNKIDMILKGTTKKSVVVEYFEYYDEYVKKFGKDKTLILMQVGSFYEAYATNEQGPNLNIIEDITGACIAHKGKNKNIVNIQNPWMWGFPMVATLKFINILIENGYHLIMIDQITPPPNIKREIVAIHSPTTYLDLTYKPVSNFMAVIYIEEIIQKHGGVLACTGLCAIDVSTGDVFIHESHSHINDDKLCLDEILRFIKSLAPKEIVIFKENLQKTTDNFIIEYLDLKGKLYNIRDAIIEYNKISYQKKILGKVYKESENITSIIDTLGLSKNYYARCALVNLLIYISDHYEDLIKGLSEPKFYLTNTNLILGNDAINQLNIISNNEEQDTKIQNLNDLLNHACTGMGKRYIRFILASPITSVKKLNNIYDNVDIFMKSNILKQLDKQLQKVHDIERLYRKITIHKLNPTQMVDFINSFVKIDEIFKIIGSNNKLSLFCADVSQINKFLNDNINIKKAKLYNISDIKENIFNIGVHNDLDKLQNTITNNHTIIDELHVYLEKLIPCKVNENNKILLKYTNRDGYYFQLTSKRYNILNKKLNELQTIKLKNETINVNEFIITKLNNNIKLTMPLLKSHTTTLDELNQQLTNMVYAYYVKFMEQIITNYLVIIQQVINTITQLDYITTIAKISKQYNYTRPIIDNKQNNTGYIIADQLRHPIVERIIDHEYIPHDIKIGQDDLKGMLIYGLNSAGKSVLMKAVGISIIMAQSGFFVPAQQYTYYPYKALYTRITGNDNLFRGLSSYSLEIVELNSILKRSDKSTLVIGDEVCRGTEHISGNAIVAATLLRLSDIGSTFIFATHLHEIVEIDDIKSRNNIKAFHLSVEHDEMNDCLIYDRILKEGSGERIYGITVAKYIIRDTDFITKALEIKNKLIGTTNMKKSKYNSELILDRCEMCDKKSNNISNLTKKTLETHHINHQKDCVDGFVKTKSHIKKNQIFNLAVLCQQCHDKIHSENININGIKMTSNGKKMIMSATV